MSPETVEGLIGAAIELTCCDVAASVEGDAWIVARVVGVPEPVKKRLVISFSLHRSHTASATDGRRLCTRLQHDRTRSARPNRHVEPARDFFDVDREAYVGEDLERRCKLNHRTRFAFTILYR